jgi:hypothetical protein
MAKEAQFLFNVVDWEGIEPSTSALRMQHYTTKPPALVLEQIVPLFYSFTLVNCYFTDEPFHIIGQNQRSHPV